MLPHLPSSRAFLFREGLGTGKLGSLRRSKGNKPTATKDRARQRWSLTCGSLHLKVIVKGQVNSGRASERRDFTSPPTACTTCELRVKLIDERRTYSLREVSSWRTITTPRHPRGPAKRKSQYLKRRRQPGSAVAPSCRTLAPPALRPLLLQLLRLQSPGWRLHRRPRLRHLQAASQ